MLSLQKISKELSNYLNRLEYISVEFEKKIPVTERSLKDPKTMHLKVSFSKRAPGFTMDGQALKARLKELEKENIKKVTIKSSDIIIKKSGDRLVAEYSIKGNPTTFIITENGVERIRNESILRRRKDYKPGNRVAVSGNSKSGVSNGSGLYTEWRNRDAPGRPRRNWGIPF